MATQIKISELSKFMYEPQRSTRWLLTPKGLSHPINVSQMSMDGERIEISFKADATEASYLSNWAKYGNSLDIVFIQVNSIGTILNSLNITNVIVVDFSFNISNNHHSYPEYDTRMKLAYNRMVHVPAPPPEPEVKMWTIEFRS